MLHHQRISRSALGLSVAILVSACLAVPAHAQCVSTQYGDLSQGSYMLQNDEWGLSNGSGWQQICTGNSSSGSWSSTWSWPKGNGEIKAYPSIVRGWQYGVWSPDHGNFPVQVSKQEPLPTSVSFSMSGTNQYDVAYDLFFSPNTDPSTPSAEMMVWLNYSGNQPAGSKVASGVTLGGVSGTWDVWVGNVGWPVWSFVRTSQVNSFSSNLQPFVYYVANTKGWLSTSWYELNIEFGTEIIQSNGANGGISVSSFSAKAY
jgi:hypothetical protein